MRFRLFLGFCVTFICLSVPEAQAVSVQSSAGNYGPSRATGVTVDWYRPGEIFSARQYRRRRTHDFAERQRRARIQRKREEAGGVSRSRVFRDKDYFDTFKKRLRYSQKKQKSRVQNPQKLENTLLRHGNAHRVTRSNLEKSRDSRGGFRYQSTLRNLNYLRSKNRKPFATDQRSLKIQNKQYGFIRY